MIVGRWMMALAGARHDVLAQTPVDRFRYIATGGVLVTTSAIAAVSATFALRMAAGLPIVTAVLVGIGWGIVILNLDRLLTIGMTRHTGWRRNTFAALPRLALAVLLGVIISTPLVLQIFQPEITAELKVLHNQHSAAFQQQLTSNPEFAAVPRLQRQLDQLNATANRDPAATAATDPAVVNAQQQVNSAAQTYASAEHAVQCEIDGTCGTGKPGVAAAAQQKLQAQAIALQNYQNAQAALGTARTKAENAATQASTTAAQQAGQIQQEIAKAKSDNVNDQAAFDASEANDNGLLARIEALNALGSARPDLGFAQFMLFLLFLLIEILPVLVKLLHLSGPPTVYEQIVDRMEHDAKTTSAREAARDVSVNDIYAEYRAELEHDQARRQYEAGLRANELLVAEQSAIAEQAIRRWSAEARQRSDREVTAWFRQPDPHRGGMINGTTPSAADTQPINLNHESRDSRPERG